MTFVTTPKHRHWDMIHAGATYPLGWKDGERLMSLCNDVMNGVLQAQPFSFRPLDAVGADGPRTVFVSAEDPIELITNYGR